MKKILVDFLLLTDVIIPAFNEEKSIALVIGDIPRHIVRNIFVVNNASSDNTAEVAARAGARVVNEPLKGYGQACLTGINLAASQQPCADVIVFLDADYADYPEKIPEFLWLIDKHNADLVIGNRVKALRQKGSMTFAQIVGNRLATWLIKIKTGYRYNDLGPFRAIRFSKLLELKMCDTNYGWTVEMQLKAVRKKINIQQISVPYRKRVGVSKISGTLGGTLKAGYKIIRTIFKYR